MTDKELLIKRKNDKKISHGKGAGENIKDLRKEQCISQAELAEKTHMSISMIRKFENDKYESLLQDMQNVCKVLGVSFAALFLNLDYEDIHCDNKTGLSERTIRYLTGLNRKNDKFIKLLNLLADNPYITEHICNTGISALKLIKKTKNK